MVSKMTNSELQDEVKRLSADSEAKDKASQDTIDAQESLIESLNEDLETATSSMDADGNTIDGVTVIREEAEVEAAAIIEDVQSDATVQELAGYRERPSATMPDKISLWLKSSWNKNIAPVDIMIGDLRPDKVYFTILNNEDYIAKDALTGINMVNGDLVAPPIHDHTWYQINPLEVPHCRCGAFLPGSFSASG